MASGTHHAGLVLVSICIAVLASYTGLSLARRIEGPVAWIRRIWLLGAAMSLGGGIWAMHFVAMLAFRLPGVQITYDVAMTALSLLIAIVFTGGGLALGALRPSSWRITAAAGLLMGSGVLAMHYLGMAAIYSNAQWTLDPTWVAISIIIAIAASSLAAWLAFREPPFTFLPAASLAMGIAIAGMHYAGMHAAIFQPPLQAAAPSISGLAPTHLAWLVTFLSVAILLLALGAARIERMMRGFAIREARTAMRLQVADILREDSTDEALQQVTTLMGQHFGVSRSGYGNLDPEEDVFEYSICWTDGSVPPLIGRFPAAAFGRKIVATLAEGRTVAVSDLQIDAISDEPRTRNTAREVDTRAILVVPFVRSGRLRTIVYLNDSKPRKWHRQDIAFMEELAERTRLVIERAVAEAELRELNSTLEQRVEERTRQLREAQEALLQSQKMEAVGQLVAGLAHDFNNVLGAVLGAFRLIERRPADADRVTELAKAGAQAAERGTALTKQLLAFSRNHTIQLHAFFVCEVIRGMQDLLARTLGPMITIKLSLNPEPIAVMADPTQVEMVILNLAINARDAMPGGGTLTVSTLVKNLTSEPDLAPGQYVEIAVSDTGSGMSDETRRRAMEPFFTTKPVGKGTGLGLAQIYGSARQAGGTVRIESTLGHGTTVRVLLPSTDAQPATEAKDLENASEHGRRTPLRVLLVDDDNDLRPLVAKGLEDAGHVVDAVDGGEAALNLLHNVTPDIAVLDFAMPRINGAELATRIARGARNLPIVFVSGYADVASIRQAVGEDAVILEKPFSLEQLLAAIEHSCARHAS